MRLRGCRILTTILGVFLLAIAGASPIPFDSESHALYSVGSPSGIEVDVYLDLTCSDCALAWPTVEQAIDLYNERVKFSFRLFPLPYHQNAFTAAKAAQVVKAWVSEAREVESFLTRVFRDQSDVLNGATREKTQPEIEAIFSAWAQEETGISAALFQSGIENSELELRTRYQFKYSALHGVFGTPIVYVGGILSESLSTGTATLETWERVLDALIQDQNPTNI